MLFEYHESGSDYFFVFDYHDDLVIFDSEEQPTQYHFFQIKTKDSGNWTLSAISKPKKNKNGEPLNSILGKMYLHNTNFNCKTASINLISNAHFNVQLKNDVNGLGYSQICLNQLAEKSAVEVCTKLKEELTVTEIDETFYNVGHLKVSSLSTKESSIHTQGRVAAYLHKIKQGKKFNNVLVYQNLFDEVKRKTAYDETISSFEQLKQSKGIGRKKMEEILGLVGESRDFDEIWRSIESTLRHENVFFGDISGIRAAWRRLEIDRMNPSNDLLRKLIHDVNQVVCQNRDNNVFGGKTLLSMMELVRRGLLLKIYNLPYEKNYIDAIILSEIYE